MSGLYNALAEQDAIGKSRQRCVSRYRLDATRKPENAVLTNEELSEVLEENSAIRQIVSPELEMLYNQIAGTNFMVAYADRNGVVMHSLQDNDFKAGEGGKAVIPGSVWTEEYRGTNALGLALHTRTPQIVIGEQHYFNNLKKLSCFAAPIFNHDDDIVGLIDATSDATARNEHTLALVSLAAKNIEKEIFFSRFHDQIILSFHARAEYLRTSSVGLLAVDPLGIILGANRNARSMLGGLDLNRKQIFGDVFEVPFSNIIDRLSDSEVIQMRDVMGSVVFMRIQHALMKPVVDVRPVRNRKPAKTEIEPDTARHVFNDEILKRGIRLALRGMTLDSIVAIEAGPGAGKTTLASALAGEHNKHAGIIHIDARSADDDEITSAFDNPAGGTAILIVDNVDCLNLGNQKKLGKLIAGFHEKQGKSFRPEAIIITGPKGWTESTDDAIFDPAFLDAASGYRLAIPDLGQRTDFVPMCRALMARISPEHTLASCAIAYLRQQQWPHNVSGLYRKLQLAVINGNDNDKVIRGRNLEKLGGRDSITPCDHCATSKIKAANCIRIKRTWIETNRNVSMTSRILGLARNTIYKHIS